MKVTKTICDACNKEVESSMDIVLKLDGKIILFGDVCSLECAKQKLECAMNWEILQRDNKGGDVE